MNPQGNVFTFVAPVAPDETPSIGSRVGSALQCGLDFTEYFWVGGHFGILWCGLFSFLRFLLQ